MTGHRRLLKRPWLMPVGIVVLIAGHVVFFNHLRHAGVSLAVLSGLAILAIAKHLGVLGPLHTLFRRRPRNGILRGRKRASTPISQQSPPWDHSETGPKSPANTGNGKESPRCHPASRS